MIRIQFIYLGLILGPLVAALVSVIIESPLGLLARNVLAGGGRKDPDYVAAGRPASHQVFLPPDRPWLYEALQCVNCISAWVAAGLFLLVAPRPLPWLEAGIGIACAWLLARFILGLARMLEYQSGD